MNFKSLINDVCCDARIKSGVFDLKNAEHVFVLQEYLEKSGYNINEIADKTAGLFEAGRFPERQAYNKDGILVTFPNKAYRDRAVNKGTHFAENPKKEEPNIFAKDGEPSDDQTKTDKEPATLDQTLNKDFVDTDDEVKRTPVEKAEDSQVVQAILTGQTPLVNYSVDEAKKYGFYNRGFKWYDSDGNYIGEQIYDESISENVIVTDAIAPAKYIKKAEKIKDIINVELLNKLEFLKNSDKHIRTKLFETIPILFAMGITDFKNVKTGSDFDDFSIGFLSSWGNLRETLKKNENEKIRNENLKLYDLVDKDLKEIGGLNGVSLSELGTPTDFIHKSIKDFYTAADSYNRKFLKGDKETKPNTADIVLIYGGTKSDVLNALNSGNIDEQDVDSMAKIKDRDIKFALISLKAGSGMLGKVLTQLVQYVGQSLPATPSDEPEKLEEGIIDKITNTIKSTIEKIKGIPSAAKNYFQSFLKSINPFTTKITNFFFKELNMDVKQLQSTELKNLENVERAIEKEIGTITEKSDEKCDKKHTEYTQNINKNLGLFKNILKSNTEDINLVNKIFELSNNSFLIEFFPIEMDSIELEQIKNLKKNLIYIIDQIDGDFEIGDCLERDTLRPIFKYRANVLSLKYIDLILKNVLKDINTSNPNSIREEFIKLSSLLSTEAVFGRNVSLPLIKYTGKKIERLKYKNNFKLEIPKEFEDVKLGKIKINLVVEEGYLTVSLYLFAGIVMKDDIATPTYARFTLDSSSGSTFTFKIEGDEVVEKI